MTATPYPLPRETRETDLLAGNGTVGPYGPTPFKVFDIADVEVWAKAEAEDRFSLATASIAKTIGAELDTVSVTFAEALPASTLFRIVARRTHERSVAVFKATTLSTAELERELSKQGSALSEARRDIDRGGSVVPGLPGQSIVFGADGRPEPGASQDEIRAAQSHAVSAGQSAASAEAWAEGTTPGGDLTRSSKEWALVAQGAVTYNRTSVRGTIDAGAGPYDVGVAIGSANNIDIKVGGVIFDHDLYTVEGTEFTFLSDPGAGQLWEAVIHTEVRQLGAPSDGTVTRSSLASGAVNSLITADMYGAVYDDTPSDRAKIKTAALAAIAAGVPFVLPNSGLDDDEGLVLLVPEDIPTLQAAHDAMLTWSFPGGRPKFADTIENHVPRTVVTISVASAEYVLSGKNITWNHPHGERILVKGRGKTGLTLASQQALTYASGVHKLRLRFSTWPASNPVAGRAMMILVPGGSGEYQNFAGVWRIDAVDPVNKDITLAVHAKTDTAVLTAIISSGIFLYIPTQFRFTNQPESGADVGGIDVHTALRISDIVLSGAASGTNAATTNGVIGREGAKVLFEQHCGVIEFQRSSLWLLNGAYAQVGFAGFNGSNSGINCLQSVIDGSRTSVQGNTAYGLIMGIGSTGSVVQAAFGGCGNAGIFVGNNASLICSGHSRRSDIGIDVKPGGFANINDMNVRGNVTCDVRRRGGGRIMLTANDAGTFDPPLDTGDSFGGFTALSATLEAVT